MGIAEPMRNNPSERKVGVNLGSNPEYLHCLNALRFVTFVYRYFRAFICYCFRARLRSCLGVEQLRQ